MADTREKLKKAALKRFLSKGYAKTTIGDIEADAGLAPRAGSFYRHFKSKQELFLEIAKTQISETPAEFDFEQISSLENTRAELILIAQIYEKASERQKPYLPMVEENRRTKFGKKLESKANQQMLDALVNWISRKPAAKSLAAEQLSSLVMVVFGGWLFYLTKSQQNVVFHSLHRDQLIKDWADIWSTYLDQSASTET